MIFIFYHRESYRSYIMLIKHASVIAFDISILF
jgi:hypothetical protein